MRILDRDSLIQALPMAAAIDAVEAAFRAHAQGDSQVPLRTATQTDAGVLLTMPAALTVDGVPALAVKAVSVFPDNAPRLPAIHAAVLLFDPHTGQLLALLDGRYLTGLRTGATSGVAARHLAREDATVLGVIGCGEQAFFQVWALHCVRPLQQVWLHNRTVEKAEQLAQRLQEELGLDAKVAATPAELVPRAEMLVTATNASEPVFDSRGLPPGATVIAIGAFTPQMRETDDHLVQRAAIYVDDREAAQSEAGDLLIPLEAGLIELEAIRSSLGEVVVGEAAGRQSDEEWILFKSVGLAIEDVTTALLAYTNALEQELGVEIALT